MLKHVAVENNAVLAEKAPGDRFVQVVQIAAYSKDERSIDSSLFAPRHCMRSSADADLDFRRASTAFPTQQDQYSPTSCNLASTDKYRS